MRLTLRTLLAYMDDILEPADHEDLGKKIEASDFATELIHRSRDTVRRLRLGTPAVLSSGSDDVLDTIDLGDANSVAEYLDNTLPPEQVADFERMCLEQGTKPDMHLAEVASCHHVLTMVLGEPAEVDADFKTRMYELPAKLASGQKLRIESAHVAPQVAQPVAPPQQSVAPSAPPKAQPASVVQSEIPDYLREAAASKRRSRRMAIAATLLAISAVVTWFAMTPEAELPADLANSGIEEFDEGEIDIEGLDDLSIETTPSDADGTTSAPAFVPGSSASSAAPAFVPGQPAAESGEMEQPEAPSVEADSPLETELASADTEIDMSEETSDLVASVPGTAPPLVPVFPGTETADPGSAEAQPDAEVAMKSDSPEAADTVAEPAVSEPAEPAGPQRLGGYLGNNDVLLIYNEVRGKWIRLPPRSPISTGDALLTLPKFFTHVVLADVNTYLSGGTRLHIPVEKLDASASDSELNLEIVYGRLLLNAGLKGSQVAMQVDDQVRVFRLESTASLAVDVQRMFVPGSDYENEAAPTKATWYLTSGTVEWPTAAGGTQTVQGPATWKTIDGIDEIPEQIEELPEWIGRELVTDVERIARGDLARELVAGQPVDIRLLELTDGKGVGRKKEVRILAAASSIFVGEFEPLVKALNDSDQKRAWETHVTDLRQALALSPDVAASVRQDFINIRGEEAAKDLMEMVVGYRPEQIGKSREAIQTGALAQLIKWLDHDSLDYRVLAIHNIHEITGKSKGYRPDDSSKQRTIKLRRILDAFEDNELQPQT